jgi:hypothetical protein
MPYPYLAKLIFQSNRVGTLVFMFKIETNLIKKITDKAWNHLWIGVVSYTIILVFTIIDTTTGLSGASNFFLSEGMQNTEFFISKIFLVLIIISSLFILPYWVVSVAHAWSRKRYKWVLIIFLIWPSTLIYLLLDPIILKNE